MTRDEMSTEIFRWWRANLSVGSAGGETHGRNIGAARALGARLRRATGPVEILSASEVHDLGRSIGIGPRQATTLALIATTLAHVKSHSAESLARRFGNGDPRPLSELRFQRLLRADESEIAEALRRALPLVDNTCNVGRLGVDLLYWSEPVRTRWCFDYFQNPDHPSDPAQTTAKEDETA